MQEIGIDRSTFLISVIINTSVVLTIQTLELDQLISFKAQHRNSQLDFD